MAPLRSANLAFADFAQRLVRDLGKRIHSGAVTERRLALMVGLSQSHLHNVVNGRRRLTPDVADQILERLDWSLLDLVESEEARSLLSRRAARLAHGHEIPLHRMDLVPEFVFPGEPFSEILVPNFWLSRAENPVAVSVAADPAMAGAIPAGAVLIVDQAPEACLKLDARALYVVRSSAGSLLRWLRHSPRGLYLVSARDWTQPSQWTLVVRPASLRMDMVQGKVIAAAQPPDGTFQPLLPPSASN